jgi:hypothetical protein
MGMSCVLSFTNYCKVLDIPSALRIGVVLKLSML